MEPHDDTGDGRTDLKERECAVLERYFDRLDEWRHMPGYQLERRADALCSLYLPEVLGTELGRTIATRVIPEFPIRKGHLDGIDDADNQSFRIDFLAISADGMVPIFVELKTDPLSRRPTQDDYLFKAANVGLPRLLAGLRLIILKTRAKQKYLSLLCELERMGLIDGGPEVHRMLATRTYRGLNVALQRMSITAPSQRPLVVYIVPDGCQAEERVAPGRMDDERAPAAQSGQRTICLARFADTVAQHGDPLSQRFARSLRIWDRQGLARTR